MKWDQLKHESIDGIIAWAEGESWCQAMANCVQDAEWHSEGDVWTHTKLVLHQLTELNEWSELSQDEQTVLIFAALFHDVAKPLTTEVDATTGRVTSPKHAVKGEAIARTVLRSLDCDLDTRGKITALVRFHGRPAFLLERDELVHEVVKLSWLTNNRLLYLFAVADTRGRVTASMTRPEENLLYWKMMAEEADCYDQPYPFANDHARFLFFRQPQPDLNYIPHEKFACDVTVMSGLPGSGKDTWLSRNRSHLPVISLDGIRQELGVDPTDDQGRVVQLAQERCRELLRAGTSFAFNATNTMRQTRGRWLSLFADYHARLEIIYVEPPFEQLLQQNRMRTDPVPTQVIERLAEKCEPPTWLECHALTICDGV